MQRNTNAEVRLSDALERILKEAQKDKPNPGTIAEIAAGALEYEDARSA